MRGNARGLLAVPLSPGIGSVRQDVNPSCTGISRNQKEMVMSNKIVELMSIPAAQALFKLELPDGCGVYGPDFVI